MVRNTFTDGQPFSVAALNSQKHAHNDEGVISGGEFSLGTGNFEVDITATEYAINGATYSLGASTVDLVESDAEDRLDLITATDTEVYNVVSGTPASESGKPNAPDIPQGEVLLGSVYVVGGSSELATADLYDEYKTPLALKKIDYLQSAEPVPTNGSTWFDTGSDDLYIAHNDTWKPALDQGEGSGLDADTLRGTVPDDKADNPHGNNQHTANYASQSELAQFTGVNYAGTGSETSSNATLVDTTGSGYLLGGIALQRDFDTVYVEVTVDGSSTVIPTYSTPIDGANQEIGTIPFIRYESSLKVEQIVDSTSTYWRSCSIAWVED